MISRYVLAIWAVKMCENKGAVKCRWVWTYTPGLRGLLSGLYQSLLRDGDGKKNTRKCQPTPEDALEFCLDGHLSYQYFCTPLLSLQTSNVLGSPGLSDPLRCVIVFFARFKSVKRLSKA